MFAPSSFSKLCVSLAVAAALGFSALPARAQEDQALTPKQIDGVRKVVKDYLMEHPEVVAEAMEALREKMRIQAEADAKQAIATYKDDLFNNKSDPVEGNPSGDVTLVEFFDYNCPYCKQSYDAMMDAAKADGKVRIVLKEFPILTAASDVASRVALAAKAQGKYDDIHRAFMKYRGQLDEGAIWRLAAAAGANVDQLKKDMTSPDIDKQIRRNRELAHDLAINGTPSYIVGTHILSQALDQGEFKQLFDAARKPEQPAHP